jgi:hypothetical protein
VDYFFSIANAHDISDHECNIRATDRIAPVYRGGFSSGILAIICQKKLFSKLDETTNLIKVCPKPTDPELWLGPKGTDYSQNEIR